MASSTPALPDGEMKADATWEAYLRAGLEQLKSDGLILPPSESKDKRRRVDVIRLLLARDVPLNGKYDDYRVAHTRPGRTIHPDSTFSNSNPLGKILTPEFICESLGMESCKIDNAKAARLKVRRLPQCMHLVGAHSLTASCTLTRVRSSRPRLSSS